MKPTVAKPKVRIWIDPRWDSFVRTAADLKRFGYRVVERSSPEWEMAREWFAINKLSFPN